MNFMAILQTAYAVGAIILILIGSSRLKKALKGMIPQ